MIGGEEGPPGGGLGGGGEAKGAPPQGRPHDMNEVIRAGGDIGLLLLLMT